MQVSEINHGDVVALRTASASSDPRVRVWLPLPFLLLRGVDVRATVVFDIARIAWRNFVKGLDRIPSRPPIVLGA
jgi:hypothetical protein